MVRTEDVVKCNTRSLLSKKSLQLHVVSVLSSDNRLYNIANNFPQRFKAETQRIKLTSSFGGGSGSFVFFFPMVVENSR